MSKGVPPGFRLATVNEYIQWLIQWLEAGKGPTHYYGYPFGRMGLLVPFEPFRVNGECGANSRSYLVHERTYFLGGEIRHNDIFLFGEPFVLSTFDRAPVYNDQEFLGLSRKLDDFIREQKEIDQKREKEYEELKRQ